MKKVKGENFYRNAKQVARAKMLTGGKAVRDRDGKIIQAAAFQKGEDETKPGRVQPDRRWFGMCTNSPILVMELMGRQATPGSFLKLLWITSGRALRLGSMTRTPFFFVVTSFPWHSSMMLPTHILARSVHLTHANDEDLIKWLFSVLTS